MDYKSVFTNLCLELQQNRSWIKGLGKNPFTHSIPFTHSLTAVPFVRGHWSVFPWTPRNTCVYTRHPTFVTATSGVLTRLPAKLSKNGMRVYTLSDRWSKKKLRVYTASEVKGLRKKRIHQKIYTLSVGIHELKTNRITNGNKLSIFYKNLQFAHTWSLIPKGINWWNAVSFFHYFIDIDIVCIITWALVFLSGQIVTAETWIIR